MRADVREGRVVWTDFNEARHFGELSLILLKALVSSLFGIMLDTLNVAGRGAR